MNFKSLIIALAMVPMMANSAVIYTESHKVDTSKDLISAANFVQNCVDNNYLDRVHPAWNDAKVKLESEKIDIGIGSRRVSITGRGFELNTEYPNEIHNIKLHHTVQMYMDMYNNFDYVMSRTEVYGVNLASCKQTRADVIRKLETTTLSAMAAKEKADRCTEARGVNADTVKNDGSMPMRAGINLIAAGMRAGSCGDGTVSGALKAMFN